MSYLDDFLIGHSFERKGETRCSMGEKDPFKVEQDGHIAWLTLNRPDNRNIMSFAFFEELTKHFERFDEDSSVRGVVIKAEGKSFTAGLDLVEFGSLLRGGIGADTREQLRIAILRGQEAMNAIERCRKPVIAAIHSHCIGGGLTCSAPAISEWQQKMRSSASVKLGWV